MKYLFLAAMLGFAVMSSTAAFADADDDAWIAKCQRDNVGQPGSTPDIITKYCTCMNGKMSSDERKSISNWEKTHPDEMAACSKEAGWK